MSVESGPSLTFNPTWWEVVLVDGSQMSIRADGASEEGDSLVFTVLVDGDPRTELEMVRVPLAAVENWAGGWLEQRRP
jgi:hypothetical protein